ncbi:MAG: glycosyltransferase, partial [Pseudomonadota bacterium]
LIRLGAALSSKPHTIIYNARISADQHERLGYDPSKTVVIPNGFDCTLLRPRPEQGDWLRHELGIPATRTVVGMVARNHPQKDVGNVVRALSLLAEGGTDVHFVITGPGFDAGNAELTHLLGEAGIGDRVTRLGQRKDIPDLVPGFDLLVLPSAWGEGFPNALGEAMACGVPCVTTDVGDSAWIVGTSGIVVPPSNPEALAEGLGRLVALGPDGRRQLGEQARQRVIDNFEIDDIVSRYEGLYEEAISSRGDAT